MPLRGQVIFRKDRLHWTLVNTQSAIDACLWIDVELLNLLIAIPLLRWMDAINGTDLDARCVLCPNARFSNDVRHDRKIPSNSGKMWSKTTAKTTRSRHKAGFRYKTFGHCDLPALLSLLRSLLSSFLLCHGVASFSYAVASERVLASVTRASTQEQSILLSTVRDRDLTP